MKGSNITSGLILPFTINTLSKLFCWFVFVFPFSIIISSCNLPEEKKQNGQDLLCPTPVNPNGDSELAVLMRNLTNETEEARQQIKEGGNFRFQTRYEDILTAEATDREEAASDEFRAFAVAFIEAVKALENASPTEAPKKYNIVVNHCLSCHKSLCPGPLSRIKKLKIK